jgi:hypothetical protein
MFRQKKVYLLSWQSIIFMLPHPQMFSVCADNTDCRTEFQYSANDELLVWMRAHTHTHTHTHKHTKKQLNIVWIVLLN